VHSFFKEIIEEVRYGNLAQELRLTTMGGISNHGKSRQDKQISSFASDTLDFLEASHEREANNTCLALAYFPNNQKSEALRIIQNEWSWEFRKNGFLQMVS